MKKAVFFDIDGTLWDREMMIPDSTREAIRRLRENDVYTFLCSGRAPSFIVNPKLLELGFDGIVSACGTCVSFQDEEIVYKTIEPELMKKTLEVLKKYNLPVILEGKNYQYAEEEDFAGDTFFKTLKEEVGENLVGIWENDMKWEVNKFCADIKNRDYEEAIKQLGEWYDIMLHGKNLAEIVPKGFSKASGIQAVCERLGIEHQNTYAFGDSVNDVEMLKYVAHGIAMGNGEEKAKIAADYITDSIYEDGVYNACKHFALI